jgi:hypothetical protein
MQVYGHLGAIKGRDFEDRDIVNGGVMHTCAIIRPRSLASARRAPIRGRLGELRAGSTMILMTAPINDPNIERGADVVATRCLCVVKGEVVHLISWRLEELTDVMAAALARAGGTVRRVVLDPFESFDTAAVHTALTSLLEQATASVLIAADGIPAHIGMPLLEVLRLSGSRHLHITRADPRVFAQSLNADPERLAMLNQRVFALLDPPSRVRVSGEGGTDLEITLAPQHPLRSSHGRPKPRELDNLPAGFVHFYPSRVNGAFVANRGVLGGGVSLTGSVIRKNPVTLELTAGRVTNVACADPTTEAHVAGYLAKHPDAGRVGIVIIPTNYLVRSEIGLGIQDALLPGLNLSLGTSHAAVTKAPYECPVQLRLFARRLDVEVGGRRMVEGGRLADWLVEGIDPFRG